MFGEDQMHLSTSTCNPSTRRNMVPPLVAISMSEGILRRKLLQHTKFGDVLPKRFALYGGFSFSQVLSIYRFTA